MEQDSTLARNDLFASMESGKPYAAYIKTILGQVAVTVWDNFLEKPVEVILKGDPRKKEEGCIVRLWSAREDLFFKRNNTFQFKKGNIILYKVPEDTPAEQEKTIEQATDEELKTIVNSKFMALTNQLNKINSVAVLYRMLSIATELDKSEKITNPIKARLSELQVKEFPQVLEVDSDTLHTQSEE